MNQPLRVKLLTEAHARARFLTQNVTQLQTDMLNEIEHVKEIVQRRPLSDLAGLAYQVETMVSGLLQMEEGLAQVLAVSKEQTLGYDLTRDNRTSDEKEEDEERAKRHEERQ